MSPFGHALCLLIVLYVLLFLLHSALKSCIGYKYLLFLQRTGLEIHLFHVKWCTQSLNRTLSRLGTWRPNLLRLWFNIGTCVSSLLVLPAMILLLQILISSLLALSGGTGADDSRILLQPVLPGVNMPMSELGYYFLTLLTCSVIHEAGHAIAAVNEDTRLLGCGIFILFVFPAAFVDLPTDQLLALRPLQQLRVYTAGIWHNLTLAAVAYLLLFSTAGILSPVYDYGQGVSVHWIDPESSVRGPTGLETGDVITAINECRVTGRASWRGCLTRAMAEPTLSLCMDKSVVETLDTYKVSEEVLVGTRDPLECCDANDAKSSLCFVDVLKWRHSACLPVRGALEKSGNRCNASLPCQPELFAAEAASGVEESYCMQPSLANNSRLLQVTRRSKQDFLYVGHPAEVYRTIQVADYIPRFAFLPMQWPNMLELFLHYLASFSGALAVLNVMPCFLLDGQHVTRVLVDLIFSRCDRPTKSVVTLTLTIVGSILLLLNIVFGLWQLM